jgi:glutathione S-transferase
VRPDARIFCLPGSAPSYAGELMLRHKAIPYRRIDLIPGWHRRMLVARGFQGRTVPALELGEHRVQTNRAMARALDDLAPGAPLFPAEPDARARVEEAERFADDELQPRVRRIVIASLARDPGSVRAHRAIGKLPIPRGAAWLRALVMRPSIEFYGATEERVRQDRRDLPDLLERLDEYLASGVLGAAQLNAADYQVAPLLAALEGVRDVEPELRHHRAAELPRRVLS